MSTVDSTYSRQRHVPTSASTIRTLRGSTHTIEYDPEAAQMKAYAALYGRVHPLEKASSFGNKDVGVFQTYQEKGPRERGSVAGTTEKSNFNEHSLIGNKIVLHEDIPKSGRNCFRIIGRIIAILLVLGILWIPGILSWSGSPKETILGVRFLFWSIWLTVVWVGFWSMVAVSYVTPFISKSASIVSSVHRWQHIHEVRDCHRYHGTLFWMIVIWLSFHPLIARNQPSNTPAENKAIIDIISRLLLGLNICVAFLTLEKVSIQRISEKFHEQSYAKRIQDLEKILRTLRILYRNTVDLVIRSDARDSELIPDSNPQTDRDDFKLQMQGQAEPFINMALTTPGKARLLARRIFYSFSGPGANHLIAEDISGYFLTLEDAATAFAFFDKDGNGDVSREEIEATCLEFYREQVAIVHSMRDMNVALNQLDSIMMSLGYVACIVIISVVMNAQIAPLIIGICALLGLSWIMGASLQEVMTSITFLFAKHPFDVGDSVVINNECYTVKEIKLLFTVFLDTNSTLVQISNHQLNNLTIHNNRRSSHMSETFTFEVDYSTTFQEVEKVREKMLEFIKSENRDFKPVFNLMVKDFSGQSKMILSADIKYKSNNVESKVMRRNKWLCALKNTLAELQIHGPAGV